MIGHNSYKKIRLLLVSALLLLFFYSAYSQSGAYTYESADERAQRMKWYEEARFGMFIHWGVYSQLDGIYKGKVQNDPKGEWIMRNLKIPVDEYATEIAGKFNPKSFNADKWIKAARDAGIKYLVITTKHHDGFALFDSDVSSYNIVDATSFGRDIIKEISNACEKYGLKFGIYYSQAQDWYHPGGLAPNNRWDKRQEGDWTNYFRTIVKGQVSELFTNYGEISLIWWDSGRAAQDKEVADEVALELVKLQPNIIVNPRLGGNLEGDFKTYEQVIPGIIDDDYNELCLTHNRSWSYKPSDTIWKEPAFILKTLVHMSALGGNFLFNVGPNEKGEFPEQSNRALEYIGAWMKVNGEAIYGTSKSPFYKLDFGEATVKTQDGKTKLYLHVYEWPVDQQLLVKGLLNGVSRAYLLADKRKVSVSSVNDGVLLKDLPEKPIHEAVSVIVLEIEEPLHVEPGYLVFSKDQIILSPSDALLTIKPQFDHIPQIVKDENGIYFDNWKNNYPHPRFKNTGNQAHWKVVVPEEGFYDTWIKVATKDDNNVLTIKGTNLLKRTLPNTSGMDRFDKVYMGELKLKKGLQTISLTGGNKDEPWEFVRISDINLRKVDD